MADWQPIETAPLRDAVLIYEKSHWTRLACLLEDGTWRPWPTEAGSYDLAYKPSHWAPLPEPPNG